MNILLIGDFSDHFDEGLKNIAKYFYNELKNENEVRIINVKEIDIKNFTDLLFGFYPDSIHYFSGPTFFSFIFLKCLKVRWMNSVSVLSALHPKSPDFLKNMVLKKIIMTLFRPDYILYQDSPDQFLGLSKKIVYFPNGVNIEKFKPVSEEEKSKLRIKYSIDKNKFVILHVGHVFSRRNLDILIEIQNKITDVQVLIVGGTYLNVEKSILEKLESNGCIVKLGYLPNINEIYALADCYVFPVDWGNTINIPLSILEAMSTNLPVVAKKYPTLSQFSDYSGLKLVDSDAELLSYFQNNFTKNQNHCVSDTRQGILQYSWSELSKKLVNDIYCK